MDVSPRRGYEESKPPHAHRPTPSPNERVKKRVATHRTAERGSTVPCTTREQPRNAHHGEAPQGALGVVRVEVDPRVNILILSRGGFYNPV